MSVPVPLLSPACFQTGTTGTIASVYLFPFNNNCPIQLLQPHYQLTEVRNLRGDRRTIHGRDVRAQLSL